MLHLSFPLWSAICPTWNVIKKENHYYYTEVSFSGIILYYSFVCLLLHMVNHNQEYNGYFILDVKYSILQPKCKIRMWQIYYSLINWLNDKTFEKHLVWSKSIIFKRKYGKNSLLIFSKGNITICFYHLKLNTFFVLSW